MGFDVCRTVLESEHELLRVERDRRVRRRNVKGLPVLAPMTGTVIDDLDDVTYLVRWDDGGKSWVKKNKVKVI